jgi:hypothetical protein
MQYLVDMRLADSGRSTTPAEGLTFLEQYERLRAGKRPGEASSSGVRR